MEPVFFAKEFENKNLINHIVFICDHASNYIPRKYRKLGISDSDFCLLYTSPSPRDRQKSRMPSSA